MSRSGYSDDCSGWELIRWRGAVTSGLRGKRGQAFLREMLAAMDALPEKRLVSNELEQAGQVCAIGSVGRARGVDMTKIDVDDHETVAAKFGIPHTMACEIMNVNDDDSGWRGTVKETPEERYTRVRKWIERNLIEWDKQAMTAALHHQIAELRGALLAAKMPHNSCEDNWYACPLSEEGCADDRYKPDECNCGADHHNAAIDRALSSSPAPDLVGVPRELLRALTSVHIHESAPDDMLVVLSSTNGGIIDVSRTLTVGVIRKLHSLLPGETK